MSMSRAWALALFVAASAAGQQLPPRPDHVVVVMMENKGFADVIGSASAPYINQTLATLGTVMTQSYGLHHPSQPNYLEIFSGSTQSVCDDSCPSHAFNAANLAASVLANPDKQRNTFIGYAENFDSSRCSTCPTSGQYVQKHCPWRDFSNVPASASQDFAKFPSDFAKLPAVAFVIPNLFDDMHTAIPVPPPVTTEQARIAREVAQGDSWLRTSIDNYARWAVTNNSLLIITWDEDSDSKYHTHCPQTIDTAPPHNRIPTIIIGQHVKANNQSPMTINHWNVLRTILDLEGLAPIGGSSNVQPISGIWQ